MAAGETPLGEGPDQIQVDQPLASAAATISIMEETLRCAEEKIKAINKKIEDKKAERTEEMYENLETIRKAIQDFKVVLVSNIPYQFVTANKLTD
jgi:phosphopantothenate synthetase